MSDETKMPTGGRSLPPRPDLEWLRKHAKRRLEDLRRSAPSAQLAEAQFQLAREHGFSSWRSLKAHVESLSIEGELFAAAKRGDVDTLRRLLDQQCPSGKRA